MIFISLNTIILWTTQYSNAVEQVLSFFINSRQEDAVMFLPHVKQAMFCFRDRHCIIMFTSLYQTLLLNYVFYLHARMLHSLIARM